MMRSDAALHRAFLALVPGRVIRATSPWPPSNSMGDSLGRADMNSVNICRSVLSRATADRERRWEPEHLPTVLCARIGAQHHTQLV